MELKFEIKQYNRGNGTHHWKAIELKNKKEIDLFEHNDGNDDMYGEYPSIEQYVFDEYKIKMSLSYKLTGCPPDIDEKHTKCIWTFKDDTNEVKIYEIPMCIITMTTSR